MKISKTVNLLLLVLMLFSSCRCANEEPDSVVYKLGLSFQDASGKDLVKGIELEEWWPPSTSMEYASSGSVKPDLYVLDIILSEPCENWDNDIYNTPARPGYIPNVNRPKLSMERFNNDSYLINDFGFWIGSCPEEKILTYKLKIPYVFGDEEIHEFVTYWDIPKTKFSYGQYYAKCYRIVFEGNEIIPQAPAGENGNYLAKIVLNKTFK